MNYYELAKKAVDYITSNSTYTQGDISLRCGYEAQSLTQMLSAKKVSKRAYENILREFKEVLNNSTFMKKDTPNHTNAPDPPNKKKPDEIYMETISDLSKIGVNLSETNKDLSAAQKDTALANRILAENQRELIEILKRNQVPIANGAKETPKVFLSEATLDLMAARGILQGLWKSKDEGRTKLDILVGEAQSIKQE